MKTARNLAVFASGTGSNFEAIADACADGRLNARVALMVCDVPTAAVVEKARKRGIETFVFSPKFYQGKAAYEAEIVRLLDERGGLICGICNGFQALIKLGLVPFGKITDADPHAPTLTFNTVSRHRSKIVRTRVASVSSPWLNLMHVGDIVNVPISHGEGRFLCEPELLKQLAENGQIATQYVDLEGRATGDIRFNPNDSVWAVEGITSPDGRVFGKMGHSERIGSGLYKNIEGSFDLRMFEAAVKYFQ